MAFRRLPIRSAFCLIWLLAVGTGLTAMLRYEQTPGKATAAPLFWPAETGISRDLKRATLIMFAHPKCPCTRASIENLNHLLTQCQDKVHAKVLFFAPIPVPDDWKTTDLWKSAGAIPGVDVGIDEDGKIAQRFGAETSGQVVLYSSHGQLLFQGGITAGRGHAGDNQGADSIPKLIANEAGIERTPVFGCSLLNPQSALLNRTNSCTN